MAPRITSKRSLIVIICMSIFTFFGLSYWQTVHQQIDLELVLEPRIIDVTLAKSHAMVRKAGSLCLDDSYVNDLNNLSHSTFLTLLSDSWDLNYLRGALVWCHQIHKLHIHPSVAITISMDNDTLNDYGGIHIIKAFKLLGATDINIINKFHNPRAKKRSWQNIFTKLLLFNPNLTRFRQIAYFDADNYPLQTMYELFSMPCNYLLGAANGLSQTPDINAGFLVIRPHKGIYESLLTLYNTNKESDERASYSRTEQKMIDDIFSGAGRTIEGNTFWYRFPYEYNSPWWQNHKHWARAGGYKAMKNIHNRIWTKAKNLKHKKARRDQIQWQQTWNEVWTMLKDNNLTENIFDLNICTKPPFLWDECLKENVTKLIYNSNSL